MPTPRPVHVPSTPSVSRRAFGRSGVAGDGVRSGFRTWPTTPRSPPTVLSNPPTRPPSSPDDRTRASAEMERTPLSSTSTDRSWSWRATENARSDPCSAVIRSPCARSALRSRSSEPSRTRTMRRGRSPRGARDKSSATARSTCARARGLVDPAAAPTLVVIDARAITSEMRRAVRIDRRGHQGPAQLRQQFSQPAVRRENPLNSFKYSQLWANRTASASCRSCTGLFRFDTDPAPGTP